MVLIRGFLQHWAWHPVVRSTRSHHCSTPAAPRGKNRVFNFHIAPGGSHVSCNDIHIDWVVHDLRCHGNGWNHAFRFWRVSRSRERRINKAVCISSPGWFFSVLHTNNITLQTLVSQVKLESWTLFFGKHIRNALRWESLRSCWCPSGWAPAWLLHTNLYELG